MSDLLQFIVDARNEAANLPASDPFAQRVQYALDDAALYAGQLQGSAEQDQQRAQEAVRPQRQPSSAGAETGEPDTTKLGLS